MVAGKLRYVLDVGEDRVFQAVAGVCTTTAFSGGQVFGESGIEQKNMVTSCSLIDTQSVFLLLMLTLS